MDGDAEDGDGVIDSLLSDSLLWTKFNNCDDVAEGWDIPLIVNVKQRSLLEFGSCMGVLMLLGVHVEVVVACSAFFD